MTTEFYDEDAFFEAWKTAVNLAGSGYFGVTHTPTTARNKWDLEPRVDRITDDLPVLSSGESIFLAALVSFYDAESGGEMLKVVGARGLSDLSARLDEPRRQVVADLLVSYAGW
ncbi:hypothetical protein [Mycolicibacterium sphagni]|uniref:Uncharacterized protein n=1 Tax=Mycolicibacterium sphagni TaxID=1786 RepID=A0ABX2K198_9MYCO|nr:hypothetical protein [Mycolicibacterium sphagni]